MLTLGVETSCDETAVAVVDGKKVLSSAVSSSIHLHARFGGVVPEIASRHHVEFIGYCLKDAVRKAGIDLKDAGLIAVTQGPGLVSSLLVGISLAKSLSLALGVPIVGVNHVLAHIWSVFLNGGDVKFPFIGFVASGGHTSIIYVKSVTDMELMGQTRDDACGESFDKVAKILNLGYPGGPVIEKKAETGSPDRIKFPRSYLNDSLDFSFSGLKTAVLYYVREKEKGGGAPGKGEVADIAAGFQESVLDVASRKVISACRLRNCRSIVVGGGVSANRKLRQRLEGEAGPNNIKVYFPPMEFCTDNAAMVAALGYENLKEGKTIDLTANADANLPLG